MLAISCRSILNVCKDTLEKILLTKTWRKKGEIFESSRILAKTLRDATR